MKKSALIKAKILMVAHTSQGHAVLLQPKGYDVTVPIFIGALEAHSLLMGYEGIPRPRPFTHDIIIDIITKLRMRVSRVEIYALKNEVFHGRLLLTGGRYSELHPMVIDSRASDALSLAVRCKCGIMISAKVVKAAGIPLHNLIFQDEPPFSELDGGFSPFFGEIFRQNPEIERENHRKQLQEELDAVVAEEKYEKAAEIRDILLLLDKQEREG
jgi:bifunctional DNase/RNase